MNAKSMVVLSAAIAMIAHTGTVLADVPLNEHPVPLVSNDVPVGATQSLSPNLCIPERTSIVKTGGGTLAVPASAPGIAPLRILAREGVVSVQSDLADTGAALPELSDSIMAKLALWVSVKDRAHIVFADGVEIERWYDVRETDTANPTCRYLQALRLDGAPGPSLANAVYVRQYWTSTNEMEMAYFGGYGSGQALQVFNNDGTPCMSRLKETSVVYGYLDDSKAFGYLFGHCRDTNEHSLWNEGNGLPWESVWGASAGDTRIWIDGKDFVRNGRNPPYGFHSMHQRYNTLMTHESLNSFENALFSGTGKAGGNGSRGGEYIGEVMIFDATLTDLERVAVQAYLNRKWFGSRSGTGEISVEDGASVEVATDGTEEADVRVVGDGAFVKKGGGTLVYRPKALENGGAAEVSIEGGAVQPLRNLSIKASAGDKITSDFPGAEIGETVTAGAAATPSTVEKTGPGYAVLASIPEGARKLSVSGGTLALRPTRPAVRRYEVAIPNGDFSDWGSKTMTTGNVFAAYGGWSRTGVAVFYHHDKWLECGGGEALGGTVNITAFGYDACPPPEGRCVLALKVAGATAKVEGVNFTEPGEYELSYLMTGRGTNNGVGARIRNYLTDENGDETYVGTATARTVKDWSDQKAFRFFVEKPGSHTLHFDHVNPWYDGTANRDDMVLINSLHLYRVGDHVANYKIPGGDFENVSGTGVNGSGNILNMNGNAQVAGWTFDNTLVPESEGKYSRSGVVGFNTYCETGRRYGSAYNGTRRPLGGVRQMLIRRSGGFATATFTPPKGKWYLKAHLAYWGDNIPANGVPTLAATVTGPDGAQADLGALPVPLCHTMLPYVWAKPFEADGIESVTLKLAFSSKTVLTGVNIDDVELVGAYENDHELVTNGDFELPYGPNGSNVLPRSGWSYVNTKVTEVVDQETGETKTNVAANAIAREYGRNDGDAFGTDHGSGDYFIEPYSQRTGCVGGFSQDIAFPHGGWYRLSYLAKTRNYYTNSSSPVDIYLVDVDASATNRIDSVTRMAPGVFAQRTTLFHVEEACTRRLMVLISAQHGGYMALAFDDISIRYAGQEGDGALRSPDPDGNGVSIDIANGARLQLDFTGTNVVNRLYIDGVRQDYGVVNAENCPSVYGPGTLLVRPRKVGVKIVVR